MKKLYGEELHKARIASQIGEKRKKEKMAECVGHVLQFFIKLCISQNPTYKNLGYSSYECRTYTTKMVKMKRKGLIR